MKRHLFLVFAILIPIVAAFPDPEGNYQDRTLIPHAQAFMGNYYYENGSTEKLTYSLFTGPSTELAAKLKIFPESSSNFDAINRNLLWGNITYWGSLALVPMDILLIENNPQYFAGTSTGLSIYFGIGVGAIIGVFASGIFFTEAENLTELEVWNYNKAVTFRSVP